MLKIINSLSPFIEDCYRRINVREYSRIMNISPPTASKVLKGYETNDMLSRSEDKGYIYYYTNKSNKDFIDLSKIYWRDKFSELIDYLNKTLLDPSIILFGSLSKAETKMDSDIDLCILAHKKDLDLKKYKKALKRNIQVFFFNSLNDIKNKELLNNIINGHVIEGRLRF